MINSGAFRGSVWSYRAGGEFHGPLGHARSDLSEIARREQNFWGISWPSGVSQGSVGRYPGPDHTENALITVRSALPGGGVHARSSGQ